MHALTLHYVTNPTYPYSCPLAIPHTPLPMALPMTLSMARPWHVHAPITFLSPLNITLYTRRGPSVYAIVEVMPRGRVMYSNTNKHSSSTLH